MKQRYLRLLALLGSIAIMALALQALGVFSGASARLSDLFFTDRPVHPRLVIIAIDDASLSKLGRWPWDRSVHAEIIRRLETAGVAAIGYDVSFSESSTERGDTELVEAIKQSKKVVLPVELKQDQPSVRPLSLFTAHLAATGFTNLPLDRDNVSRRLPVLMREKDGSSVSSFAQETLRVAGISIEKPLTDGDGNMRIHYPVEPGGIKSISAGDLLQQPLDTSVLKGAIVFVGATARDLHDEQLVPTSQGLPMSGVEIHASIANTLLQKDWLIDASYFIHLLLIVLFSVLLGGVAYLLRPRWSLVILMVSTFALAIGGILAYDAQIIIDILWPFIAGATSFLIASVYRFVTSEQDKGELKNIFGRYVSPAVVEEIVKDPKAVRLGGDRRRMTVLFSDLRGFTAMSEGLTPEQLVEVLNLYLDEMTKIVFEQGGVLDKYIGDAVMAFWNAPMNQEDHAKRAVSCALAMTKRLQEMNAEGTFLNKLQLNLGVGMNTGEMVVGNIGSSLRHDYTVIGDSVNLASRTESLCKDYGCKVIVTKNTLDEIGNEFFTRELDQVAVKGKKEPIRIYEVMGMQGSISTAQKSLAKAYGEALALYYNQRFTEAKQAFIALVASSSDVASQLFVERCAEYEQNPPPANWDGTFVRKGK